MPGSTSSAATARRALPAPAASRRAGRSRWRQRKRHRARISRPPPASCWRWPSPLALREPAATAPSCSPIGPGLPADNPRRLPAESEQWLVRAIYDKISLKELSPGDLSDALMALLPWELRARLEREAPTHFEAPTGTMLAIDYEAEQGPTIAVRLQELFGLNTHPSIAKGAVPLVLELLSPAHRPVQVTRDLPGFWRGSYAAVRSDLRGRYPRHPWPEDPANALPTRRVKPRGT